MCGNVTKYLNHIYWKASRIFRRVKIYQGESIYLVVVKYSCSYSPHKTINVIWTCKINCFCTVSAVSLWYKINLNIIFAFEVVKEWYWFFSWKRNTSLLYGYWHCGCYGEVVYDCNLVPSALNSVVLIVKLCLTFIH